MNRLGQRAAAVFLFLGLIAMLVGLFDAGNGPLSFVFAVLLGMPWTFLVEEMATDSLMLNSLMAIGAICLNALIIYFLFAAISKHFTKNKS